MNLFDGALFGNHENGDPYWMLTMSILTLTWRGCGGGRARRVVEELYTRSTRSTYSRLDTNYPC